MPTIGNNQFPYPNTSDEPNIPGDLQNLASTVDTAIGGGNRFIDTLANLQAIPAAQLFEGMRATVTSDTTTSSNGEYVYTGGAWFQLTGNITDLFTPTNANMWNVNLFNARLSPHHVHVDFQIIRKTTDWNTGGNWLTSNFMTFPTRFAPTSELHAQAISNATTPQSILAQIVNNTLNLRKPSNNDTIAVNCFVEFTGGWNY